MNKRFGLIGTSWLLGLLAVTLLVVVGQQPAYAQSQVRVSSMEITAPVTEIHIC